MFLLLFLCSQGRGGLPSQNVPPSPEGRPPATSEDRPPHPDTGMHPCILMSFQMWSCVTLKAL